MNTNQTEIQTKPNIRKRAFAVFIDYFIIYGFISFYIYLYGEPDPEGGYSVNGLPAFVPVLFWGVMTVGLEQIYGATLGNGFVGLKPVSIKNNTGQKTLENYDPKLTFGQSFIRHLLDPIDMCAFGLVGFLVIKNTDFNQRVGDLCAETIVVNAKSD